jgi:hypothetical protein
MLVDKYAHRPNVRSVYVWKTFYGQLENIFVMELPAVPGLLLTAPTTLLLADVRPCIIESTHPSLDIHYYNRHQAPEIVDVNRIKCLVGRIPDGKQWALIDRSGAIARESPQSSDDDNN